VNASADGAASTLVPAWRIAAAIVVLAALGLMGAALLPVYLRNFKLESFLRQTQSSSDGALRKTLVDKGHELGLEIVPDRLQIRRSPGNSRADIHYVVRVSLSLYTVDLHFSSTTGD